MLSPTNVETRGPQFDIDLSTPDLFVDGYPADVFKLLRAEAPVYWNREANGEGFWVISRYKDVWAISLDQATFSSWQRGAILKRFSEGEAQELEGTRLLMLNMDPPKHTKYRRLVNVGFSPKMVNRMEVHVREMTGKIIDAVARRGECDFVTEIAAELPLQVIVEMMGVPLEDRRIIFDWSNTLVGFDDPEYSGGGGNEKSRVAAMEMFMYAHQLFEQRRANPRDDLATLLTQVEVEGEKLTDLQLNNFFMLLLVAGNETTRNSISGGMLELINHPEERARLLADRSLLPTAVEEIVRWVSPVITFIRTATRDVDFHGHQIRKGERVSLWYGSANRDEEVFPDGERFDVGRTPNDHLGFGIGPHFCLGANLARLEIRIMFDELLRRLPDMELAAAPARLRSNFLGGIKSMPVRFTPER